MQFEEYFDKVYGCWLGKCICGNIGAPFEGMKQKLSVKFSQRMVEEMLPNDDLDLQVLFLDVVKKYGENFTSDQLAESFYKNCPYAPGEYAYFKKNYYCGIHPPVSGRFNNEVYKNGMGCAIRSELWACLAPGDPERAVDYCKRDGCLDHYGDGLYGEVFMTALQSLAFVETDVAELIRKASGFISQDCELSKLISDVIDWSEATPDYFSVRAKIIGKYGSAEATSLFQNIGFIVLSLLRGDKDFIGSAVEICNCGFDTDCTCATLGAIRGILIGAKKINQIYDFSKAFYKLGVNALPRSGSVYDLSIEVAELGAQMSGIHYDEQKTLVFEKPDCVQMFVEYCDGASIGFGERKKAILNVKNNSNENISLKFETAYPLSVEISEVNVLANSEKNVEIYVHIDSASQILPVENHIYVRYGKDKQYAFGFMGKKHYDVFGPFWKNNVEVPALRENQSYWDYFSANNLSEQMDKIRFYHTNCFADDIDLKNALKEENFLCSIDCPEDMVRLEDYLKFDGQAKYFLRYKFSSKAIKCGVQIGYNSAMEFYLNGKLLTRNDKPVRYTPENSHCFDIELLEGENEIIIAIKKWSDFTRFSFDFLENGACSNHIVNFKIIR